MEQHLVSSLAELAKFLLTEIEVVDKLSRFMEHARKEKITMRLAALSLGSKRVQEAKKIRGLFP